MLITLSSDYMYMLAMLKTTPIRTSYPPSVLLGSLPLLAGSAELHPPRPGPHDDLADQQW